MYHSNDSLLQEMLSPRTGVVSETELFSRDSMSAQQQYEVAYRDLEYQINNMVQTRDSSFIRADDFDRLSVETARVSQMFYDQWYNLGQRTLLDVLTAENDHYNNQLSAINNRYDGYMSNMSIMASAAMLLNWLDVKENN